jgi:hypothetical protein
MSIGSSLKVKRETQAVIAMKKRQTIGELGGDATAGLRRQVAIGFLENGFEPQAANAKPAFITSIFAIQQVTLAMMHTTVSQMRHPPNGQIHPRDAQRAGSKQSIKEWKRLLEAGRSS